MPSVARNQPGKKQPRWSRSAKGGTGTQRGCPAPRPVGAGTSGVPQYLLQWLFPGFSYRWKPYCSKIFSASGERMNFSHSRAAAGWPAPFTNAPA